MIQHQIIFESIHKERNNEIEVPIMPTSLEEAQALELSRFEGALLNGVQIF